MTDAQLGKHIRTLLAMPNVERVEIYGIPGKEGVRALQLVQRTWTKQQSKEQIRPKS